MKFEQVFNKIINEMKYINGEVESKTIFNKLI